MRTIRIILSALLALLPLTLSAQEIRDIDIRVVVAKDGSATVTTDWDVTVTSGTEWYIPVGNLGPMKVTSLKVSEERLPPVDTQRNHIQSAAAIVLPFGTAVRVVLNVMRRYSSAQQFFFRGRHQCFFLYD